MTVADPHPERRAQAEALGAPPPPTSSSPTPLVFEAVGRPDAWRDAVRRPHPAAWWCSSAAARRAATCRFRPAPLHYDELDLRGAFHHDRDEVDRALGLLAAGDVDWRAFAGEPIGLDGLAGALAPPVRRAGAQAGGRPGALARG